MFGRDDRPLAFEHVGPVRIPRLSEFSLDKLIYFTADISERVLQLALSRDGFAITSILTLESNHPDFGDPTLGTIIGDELFYVANNKVGQWMENPKGELPEPVILKVRLAAFR